MAKQILLVRHARLGPEHAGRLIGGTDLPIDAAGHAQACALAERLARLAPGRCCSSPMLRCRETVRPIAVTMPGLRLEFDDDLREIDFGQWENHTFEEAAAANPRLIDDWAAFSPDFAFPGGERVGDFLRRVHAAADRMARDEADCVLAVAHGGVIRTMICHLLGLEPWQYVAFKVGYAGLVVIRMFGERGVLTGLENVEEAADG